MIQVFDRLYAGGESGCFEGAERWAVVHACRHPCFRRAARRLGAREEVRVLEEGANLYLDLIDAPARYFEVSLLEAFLGFAARHWERGSALMVHCNQGVSRAPSLAMLFLAKGLDRLPAGSYDEAREGFAELWPDYAPSEGIRSFLRDHWAAL